MAVCSCSFEIMFYYYYHEYWNDQNFVRNYPLQIFRNRKRLTEACGKSTCIKKYSNYNRNKLENWLTWDTYRREWSLRPVGTPRSSPGARSSPPRFCRFLPSSSSCSCCRSSSWPCVSAEEAPRPRSRSAARSLRWLWAWAPRLLATSARIRRQSPCRNRRHSPLHLHPKKKQFFYSVGNLKGQNSFLSPVYLSTNMIITK